MKSMECIPTEHAEQVQLFTWARWQSAKYPELELMHAIPNGGLRNKKTAALLAAEGVKSGVCDIFLPSAHCGYHGLYIEMKRTKGGRVSDEQNKFIEEVTEQGYAAFVCKGFEAAREIILAYLTGKL